jgi:glc operon protein GlcG
MEKNKMQALIDKIFKQLEQLIPVYMENAADRTVSNGNLAVCIIDETGTVYGKMFGTNKPRLRQSYRVAWTKASQVWLTGVKTGAYEKMVFNGEVDENAHGIEAPDLIGWEGGQPLTLRNGKIISVGFSGFRGTTDIEIMVKALAAAEHD